MSKTVREFVTAIGGNEPASELFGVTVPAICNWKKHNRFPLWARARARDIARARRFKVDDDLVRGGTWSDAAE